jgi:hypothetical protein
MSDFNVVCPHCGYEYEESYDFTEGIDDKDGEYYETCNNCEKDFIFGVEFVMEVFTIGKPLYCGECEKKVTNLVSARNEKELCHDCNKAVEIDYLREEAKKRNKTF